MAEFIKNLLKSKIRAILAVFSVVWLIGVTIGLFTVQVPPDNKEILLTIVSFATGVMLGGVFGFYFGDSEGKPVNG